MTALTVFYDYTDPWCYVAVFRADWLRLIVSDLEVHWHPFELFPDLPARGARPRNPAFLRRKIQYDIDEATHDLPVSIHVPTERVTNSRLALEVGLLARDQGIFDVYHRATFRAFFEQGLDLGSADTLVGIGRAAGLAPDLVGEALGDHRYTPEVVRLRQEAENLGVAAIPTFVANNQGVIGIVAQDKLLRIVTSSA